MFFPFLLVYAHQIDDSTDNADNLLQSLNIQSRKSILRVLINVKEEHETQS